MSVEQGVASFAGSWRLLLVRDGGSTWAYTAESGMSAGVTVRDDGRVALFNTVNTVMGTVECDQVGFHVVDTSTTLVGVSDLPAEQRRIVDVFAMLLGPDRIDIRVDPAGRLEIASGPTSLVMTRTGT